MNIVHFAFAKILIKSEFNNRYEKSKIDDFSYANNQLANLFFQGLSRTAIFLPASFRRCFPFPH